MNLAYGNIKFDLELPNTQNELALLDFKVKINTNGAAEFDFYKKPARSAIFMNAATAIPASANRRIICNETQRIRERCSDPEKAAHHLATFQDTLKANGFTKRLQDITAGSGSRNPVEHNTTPFIHVPFISDHINTKIKRIFKKVGLQVMPYSRNRNLRQLLASRENPAACTMDNCSLDDTRLCNRRGIVYQLQCNRCGESYVGSTTRMLHQRIREHVTRTNSAFYQHLQDCTKGAGFRTDILALDPDPKNLRLKEGLLICEKAPSINKKEEEGALISLVQPFI